MVGLFCNLFNDVASELYTWQADFSLLRYQKLKPNMAEIETMHSCAPVSVPQGEQQNIFVAVIVCSRPPRFSSLIFKRGREETKFIYLFPASTQFVYTAFFHCMFE